MSVQAEFIRSEDEEADLRFIIDENNPHVVVDYDYNPPLAILTQCVERGQGALIFSFDAENLIKTEAGIVVPEDLLCFSSLLRYVPPGLQARYCMVRGNGDEGTLVITPEITKGWLN